MSKVGGGGSDLKESEVHICITPYWFVEYFKHTNPSAYIIM